MLSQSCVRSPASHFRMRVRVQARRWFLWAAPPRVGAQRTHLTNICCSVHASVVLANTVLAVVRLTHCAQDLRSSLGICRRVGTRRWWTSVRLGRAVAVEVVVWTSCCCRCWFSEWVLSASASSLAWAIGRQLGCTPWYRSWMVQSHSGQIV
jgi:hypothetical protein